MASSIERSGCIPAYFFQHLENSGKFCESHQKLWARSRELANNFDLRNITLGEDVVKSSRVIVISDDSNDQDAVLAKQHGVIVMRFLEKQLNRNSFDDKGSPLKIYVHAKDGSCPYPGAEACNRGNRYRGVGPYVQAKWCPRPKNAVLLGEGDGRWFTSLALDIDILAHEVGHGVCEYTTGFKYEGESGALNESWADVFGSMVKQYANQQKPAQADWLIGDQLVKDLGESVFALRSLKDPGSAYDFGNGDRDPQINHKADMVDIPPEDDNGGVHILSGIPNKAFYLFASGFDNNSWDHTGMVWYNAMKSCNSTSVFSDFVGETFSAVDNMYNDSNHTEVQGALARAWDSVGFSPQDYIESGTSRAVAPDKQKAKRFQQRT